MFSSGSRAPAALAFHSENCRRLTAARSSGRLNVNGQLVPRVPLGGHDGYEVVGLQFAIDETLQAPARAVDALERHPRVVDDQGDDAARLDEDWWG